MSLYGIFNNARSSLLAQQVALEVTSENISNVNTPGYSKQTPVFETAPTVTINGVSIGTGVNVVAVQRSYDGLLQQQIVTANGEYGESSAKQAILEQIEPAFNELDSSGLSQATNDFFNSWHDLSFNPSGMPERQTVIARAQTLVDTFHQMSANLQAAQDNADDSLTGITSDITDKAKNIASLNNQILQTERLGGNANELRDQREYLVQEMAKEVGVTYQEQSDGTLTVTLPGGEGLVQGIGYGTVSTQVDGTTGLNAIMFNPIGGGAAVDITSTIGGTSNSLGKIGGMLQVRDSIIPGYEAKLDEMANQIITSINTLHSSGYGLDGTQNNFFTSANMTSSNISVDSLITGHPNKIAAAASSPVTTSGSGDNTNALALAAIRSTSITFSVTLSGSTTISTATFSSFYSSFVSGVGIDTQNAKNITKQNESFLKQLNTLRESVSGVSLDEELTSMVKYQKAFQAASKVINATTDMLDTVLSLVR